MVPEKSAMASPNARSGPRNDHLPGLDSIRFLCAFWVLMFHVGPLVEVPGNAPGPVVLVRTFFNGGAAVMMFFVISGLCIHWPQTTRPLDAPIYLARRLVRIGLPVIAAVILCQFLDGGMEMMGKLLWTLYCEMAYYVIYPLLLLAARRIGWYALLGISTIACVAVLMRNNHEYLWDQHPAILVAVVGLPSWLCGCIVAERVRTARRLPVHVQVGMTICLLGFSIRGTILNDWLQGSAFLVLFGFIAAGWLGLVLASFRTPWRWLEAAGAMTFSLYLAHGLVMVLISYPDEYGPPLVHAGWQCLRVLASLAAAVVFYVLIERPSQLLVKHIRRAPAIPPVQLVPPVVANASASP